MAFLNVGDHGWQIDDGKTIIDEQQAKIDALLLLTEKSLQLLEKVAGFYVDYGDDEAFTIYQGRVEKILRKASYENFFKEDDENTDQN